MKTVSTLPKFLAGAGACRVGHSYELTTYWKRRHSITEAQRFYVATIPLRFKCGSMLAPAPKLDSFAQRYHPLESAGSQTMTAARSGLISIAQHANAKCFIVMPRDSKCPIAICRGTQARNRHCPEEDSCAQR